jgi:transposase
MFEVLESFEDVIRSQLLKSPVVYADETGLRVDGKGHWLDVISNSDWT